MWRSWLHSQAFTRYEPNAWRDAVSVMVKATDEDITEINEMSSSLALTSDDVIEFAEAFNDVSVVQSWDIIQSHSIQSLLASSKMSVTIIQSHFITQGSFNHSITRHHSIPLLNHLKDVKDVSHYHSITLHQEYLSFNHYMYHSKISVNHHSTQWMLSLIVNRLISMGQEESHELNTSIG